MEPRIDRVFTVSHTPYGLRSICANKTLELSTCAELLKLALISDAFIGPSRQQESCPTAAVKTGSHSRFVSFLIFHFIFEQNVASRSRLLLKTLKS